MIKPKENNFNRTIGLRLLVLRQKRKLSQGQLGALVGLSGQQIQKYENAINRMTAERVQDFSSILRVPVTYFYEQEGEENTTIYSCMTLITASELDKLPDDIKRSIGHLIKTIDESLNTSSNDNG